MKSEKDDHKHVINFQDIEFISSLESFNKKLNEDPPEWAILERKDINVKGPDGMYQKFKFLSIDYVQNKIQELFGGHQELSFTWSVLANECLGVIHVKIFHPIFKEWWSLQGVASVIIQQKKDSDPTDVSKKYLDAMVKGFPHLKSDCIRNAFRDLGKCFGRSLNREFVYDFEPFSLSSADQMIKLEEEMKVLQESSRLLEEFKEKVRMFGSPTELYKNSKDLYDMAVATDRMTPGDLQILQDYARSRYRFLKGTIKADPDKNSDLKSISPPSKKKK